MIFLTIILISLVIMIWAWKQSWEKVRYDSMTGAQIAFNWCFVPLVVSCIFLFASYCIHSGDIGVVRKGNLQVVAQTNRVHNLKNDLLILTGEGGKNLPTALLNKDNPVASIVGQLAEAEKDLAKTTIWKNQSEIDIEARKSGPFAIIVWIFGEK